MPSITRNGKKTGKALLWFPVFVVGISAVTYTQAIPEPAKLLLLGAFLIGLAFWGRKHIAEHGVRVSTESRVLSTEQYEPQTTDNGTTAGSAQYAAGRRQQDREQRVEQNQEAASGMRLAAKR